MKIVELIYDNDCPNVEQTCTHLLRAFSEAGIPAKWVEWERSDDASPPHVRRFGSPTVLVDGQDIAGVEPSGNISCCRLYPAEDGSVSGVPSVEMIVRALRKTGDESSQENSGRKPAGWRSSLAVLPGIGASLLPVGVCPACWPIYAGLLSSFGLGFLLKSAYLMPLTAIFLAIAVAGLAYKARTRRGYRPFLLGLAASTIVLVGKFIFGIDTAMYAGIAVLIAASLWNAWPRKNVGTGRNTCPACVSSGTDVATDPHGGAE